MNEKLDTLSIVSLVKDVLDKGEEKISLHEPNFQGNEWKYIKDCLDSGWVSSVGKYVNEFEKRLVEYTGVKYAISVVNGTAALHICLKISGVSINDEVLLPALTFVATANAVKYCGGIPHFVDSEYVSLGINPKKLNRYLKTIATIKDGCCYNKLTNRRIKAVIAMHTFGHPVDLEKLMKVCQRYKLILIEDAAEALGSYYKDKHVGNWGNVSSLSFNGNKIITTGGGGAILTNDRKLATIAKHITTTAKLPHRWALIHDKVGYNYRMPNINAALGCAQIEQLDRFVQKKRSLAKKYHNKLTRAKGITIMKEPKYARSNYWLNTILIDKKHSNYRDELLNIFHQNNIYSRPAWTLINKLIPFKDCPSMDLSTSESLEKRIINIPSSACFGDDIIEK
ncbi:LegC family aminotransferase [Clostridiaceae bacterium M8S5]|nr:LegC family aminotransferase [Clostridiaceae bacterium M8S5]